MTHNFINGTWSSGNGSPMESRNPSDGSIIWTGVSATPGDVNHAFTAARAAFEGWSRTPVSERRACVERFQALALEAKPKMAELIARETGKVLWDATGEAGALSPKVAISLESYDDRTGQMTRETAFGHAELSHRPHGVMAVLGPYNFPAHLPNGQIIPALIAGNTVVFKPSEQTPAVGEALMKLYAKAGFPDGVVNLVQGARETGTAVLGHSELDGVLFTGSAKTGAYIHKLFGGRPEIILALEMGGNNPLIVWDVENTQAAASIALQSAFVTTGQRCTCARRLIIPAGRKGDKILDALVPMTESLPVGQWNDTVAIGPVVGEDVARHILSQSIDRVDAGAKPVLAAQNMDMGGAFIRPGIYDVTDCDVPDEEIFGPILQVIRAPDWDAAMRLANNTRFGLAAGLVSDRQDLWSTFTRDIRAGIVNFNRPTTGAASFLPFGGPGASGNHNPGAYYAADFCAWPMASQVADTPEYLSMPGMTQ